jgi:acetolactate synthase-1/2/3 large subunit
MPSQGESKAQASKGARRMKGYEYLAAHFNAYGVTHLFEVPSVLTWTSAEGHKSHGLKSVLCHSENAAGFMADGYARATGRVGVCACQQIGTSNLAAGLRDACQACSPVVAISGGAYVGSHHRHKYQEIDPLLPFEAVTKLNAQVEDVSRLADMMRAAWRVATTGQPGPVHLSFQGHEAEVVEKGEMDIDLFFEEQYMANPAFRIPPDPAAVASAAQLLAEAERPVLLAGGGTKTSGASAELRRLAEKLQAPVVTALNAKECMPADHPLSGGCVGVYGRESAAQTVSEADLVVFIGSKTGSGVTRNYSVPHPGVKAIQIDIDPVELGRNYPNAVSILGDAKVTLAALVEAVSPARRESWVARARQLDDEWEGSVAAEVASDAVPMRPERLCSELSKAFPPDALILTDTGQATFWAGMFLDLTSPEQSFLRANGSLGWGFPAALGAKMGVGDSRSVILFTGDGGFFYHMSELETAVRTGTNIVVVVNDNRSLNEEEPFVKPTYDQIGTDGHEDLWVFEDLDLAAMARQVGANGIRVDRPSDFAGAMEKALGNDRITVVDARTDMTAVCPWDRSSY